MQLTHASVNCLDVSNSAGVDFDFFELHEMAPENVAMVLIKYLQALPDPIYCAKFEGHFRIALGTFFLSRLCQPFHSWMCSITSLLLISHESFIPCRSCLTEMILSPPVFGVQPPLA